MRQSTLTDQVVVITGANGGFGQALATALAAKGARLARALRARDRVADPAAIARNPEVAKSLAASLGDDDRAAGFAADVQSLEQLEEAMHAIRLTSGESTSWLPTPASTSSSRSNTKPRTSSRG
jgi:NAD(P)-dependent dehydrogenase (short-subunit alcohol dehydrogenase family)